MKATFIFFIAVLIALTSSAQTYKTVTLIEQRNHYLNGGLNSTFGGQSRVVIKVDLPANTKRWYYSFSTSPGESGTKVLNLGMQVAAAVSTSGASALASSQISVPPGSGTADIFVLSTNYRDAFVNKADENWRYYGDISVEKSKQAVQSVDASYGNSFYLGLRNPSSLDGINIFIEVVAVVEEAQQQTEEQSQAFTLGNLGWKAFERGDYDRCLDLSKQALSLDNSLGFVHFNIALSYLIKGQNTEAMMEYTKAIAVTKKSTVAKRTFDGAIGDLNTYMDKFPSKPDAQDILELLQQEASRY